MMIRPVPVKPFSLLTAISLIIAHIPLTTAAQQSSPGRSAPIYVCVDAQGRKLTSDRPITECLDRDQRILNADGSTRGVHRKALSPSERAEQEEQAQRRALANAAKLDAVRRDRNLLMRYPNEAAHQKARELALDDLRSAIELSQQRLTDLDSERKDLLREAEFYTTKKNLPINLKRSLSTNEASIEALKGLLQNQQTELSRVTSLYQQELMRLRRLWAGEPPGSLPLDASLATQPNSQDSNKPASIK